MSGADVDRARRILALALRWPDTVVDLTDDENPTVIVNDVDLITLVEAAAQRIEDLRTAARLAEADRRSLVTPEELAEFERIRAIVAGSDRPLMLPRKAALPLLDLVIKASRR